MRQRGHDVLDFGTNDATPVDYPQYGFAVGEAVASGQAERAANEVPGDAQRERTLKPIEDGKVTDARASQERLGAQ